jgi:hypothetical protein
LNETTGLNEMYILDYFGRLYGSRSQCQGCKGGTNGVARSGEPRELIVPATKPTNESASSKSVMLTAKVGLT